MAQLMRGSLDVVPAFPEVLEVKGMKKWLDGLKWSTGYRAIKPQSQLDVEGDFVYHDTEFGQIILDQLPARADGLAPPSPRRWRTPRSRPRRWPTASSRRRDRLRSRWHTSARRHLSVPADAKRPRARRGAAQDPVRVRPDPPDRHLRGDLPALSDVPQGSSSSLEQPNGGLGLQNYSRLIHDELFWDTIKRDPRIHRSSSWCCRC